jgi:hypothetical protein
MKKLLIILLAVVMGLITAIAAHTLFTEQIPVDTTLVNQCVAQAAGTEFRTGPITYPSSYRVFKKGAPFHEYTFAPKNEDFEGCLSSYTYIQYQKFEIYGAKGFSLNWAFYSFVSLGGLLACRSLRKKHENTRH